MPNIPSYVSATGVINVLLLTDPPEIPKDSIVTNPKIIQGKAHTLTCPATGTPPPTITWYRNGQFIDLLLDPNIELRSNGRQLHIKSVDIQNQGQYTCSASNEAGVTDLNFDLEVLGMYAFKL